jgi:hypothetical protein
MPYLTVDELVTKCELLAEQFTDEVMLATLPEPTHENRPMQLMRMQLYFRIRHCGAGNTDPCRTL